MSKWRLEGIHEWLAERSKLQATCLHGRSNESQVIGRLSKHCGSGQHTLASLLHCEHAHEDPALQGTCTCTGVRPLLLFCRVWQAIRAGRVRRASERRLVGRLSKHCGSGHYDLASHLHSSLPASLPATLCCLCAWGGDQSQGAGRPSESRLLGRCSKLSLAG